MLVLSRKVGERILLGEKIKITVVRVSGGGVRLGIEAPADIAVVREEVAQADASRSAESIDNSLAVESRADQPG